jgi:hypothetical protein
MLQGGARQSATAICCGLLSYGGRVGFVEGALGCSFTGDSVSGNGQFVEDEGVGEASIRVFSQKGGSGFSWADCWAGIEAQRGA